MFCRRPIGGHECNKHDCLSETHFVSQDTSLALAPEHGSLCWQLTSKLVKKQAFVIWCLILHPHGVHGQLLLLRINSLSSEHPTQRQALVLVQLCQEYVGWLCLFQILLMKVDELCVCICLDLDLLELWFFLNFHLQVLCSFLADTLLAEHFLKVDLLFHPKRIVYFIVMNFCECFSFRFLDWYNLLNLNFILVVSCLVLRHQFDERQPTDDQA